MALPVDDKNLFYFITFLMVLLALIDCVKLEITVRPSHYSKLDHMS